MYSTYNSFHETTSLPCLHKPLMSCQLVIDGNFFFFFKEYGQSGDVIDDWKEGQISSITIFVCFRFAYCVHGSVPILSVLTYYLQFVPPFIYSVTLQLYLSSLGYIQEWPLFNFYIVMQAWFDDVLIIFPECVPLKSPFFAFNCSFDGDISQFCMGDCVRPIDFLNSRQVFRLGYWLQ